MLETILLILRTDFGFQMLEKYVQNEVSNEIPVRVVMPFDVLILILELFRKLFTNFTSYLSAYKGWTKSLNS